VKPSSTGPLQNVVVLVLAHDLKSEPAIKLQRSFIDEEHLKTNGQAEYTRFGEDGLHAPPTVAFVLMFRQQIKLVNAKFAVFDLMGNVTDVSARKRNDVKRLLCKMTLVGFSLDIVLPRSPDLFGVFAKRRFLDFVKKIKIGRSRKAKGQPYPPAIAPTTRNGASPFAIGSGSGESGESFEKSSPQAKNRINGRRSLVT